MADAIASSQIAIFPEGAEEPSFRSAINGALEDLDQVPDVRDLGTYEIRLITSGFFLCDEDETELERLNGIFTSRSELGQAGRVRIEVLVGINDSGELDRFYNDPEVSEYFGLLPTLRNVEVECAAVFPGEESPETEEIDCPGL